MNARESGIKIIALVSLVWCMLATAPALAKPIEPYSAAALAKHQQAGDVVALQFNASWCPVCKKQRNAMKTLAEDKGLDAITLMAADFDSETALTKAHKVKNQSTIILFKGKTEISRSEGLTDPAEVKSFLQKAK